MSLACSADNTAKVAKEDGAIVYTGDFVFDSTVPNIYKTDIGKLAYVGKQGVLCLMCESIYADRFGHTSPNNRVPGFIREVLSSNPNRSMIVVHFKLPLFCLYNST